MLKRVWLCKKPCDEDAKKKIKSEPATAEEDFKSIISVLEDHLDESIKGIQLESVRNKRERSKSPSKRISNTITFGGKDHDCSKSKECKPEWDAMGCIKLYHINTVDERRKSLLKYQYILLASWSNFS